MANTKLRNPQIVTDRPSCESLKQQSLGPTGQLSLNSHKRLSDTIQWCQHDPGGGDKTHLCLGIRLTDASVQSGQSEEPTRRLTGSPEQFLAISRLARRRLGRRRFRRIVRGRLRGLRRFSARELRNQEGFFVGFFEAFVSRLAILLPARGGVTSHRLVSNV
jgi:hypothetical protein